VFLRCSYCFGQERCSGRCSNEGRRPPLILPPFLPVILGWLRSWLGLTPRTDKGSACPFSLASKGLLKFPPFPYYFARLSFLSRFFWRCHHHYKQATTPLLMGFFFSPPVLLTRPGSLFGLLRSTGPKIVGARSPSLLFMVASKITHFFFLFLRGPFRSSRYPCAVLSFGLIFVNFSLCSFFQQFTLKKTLFPPPHLHVDVFPLYWTPAD